MSGNATATLARGIEADAQRDTPTSLRADLAAARTEAAEAHRLLALERAARMRVEGCVREQDALLAERTRLLAEREDMLAVLAHEVRQPLNNASAALQSAAVAVARHCDRDHPAATRLERANAVLWKVTATIDNTLTDAVLLQSDKPLARQDIDIDTLAALTIADIDPTGRRRVRCELATPTRTASMNAGLVRIALRNLVANALDHSPAGSEVLVRIADLDDPLALVVDVVDDGEGIAPGLLPTLFHRGARGDVIAGRVGHGLGLHIVRRVMEMHGGEVRVIPGQPRGLTMRLIIPQGLGG
jgi:signal transduction histidine kinase